MESIPCFRISLYGTPLNRQVPSGRGSPSLLPPTGLTGPSGRGRKKFPGWKICMPSWNATENLVGTMTSAKPGRCFAGFRMTTVLEAESCHEIQFDTHPGRSGIYPVNGSCSELEFCAEAFPSARITRGYRPRVSLVVASAAGMACRQGAHPACKEAKGQKSIGVVQLSACNPKHRTPYPRNPNLRNRQP